MTEFVYFVECDPNVDNNLDQLKYVKIGKTNSLKALKNRMSSFIVGNPFKLNLLGYIEGNEKELQNKFYNYLRRGEWFFLTDKLKQEINNLNLIKPDKKYFNNFFYNQEIVLNFIDYKNKQIKKQEAFKKKQEQEKLSQTKFNHVLTDTMTIDFFVDVLFNNNKDYNYSFQLKKNYKALDLFNVVININESHLKIQSIKDQRIFFLSRDSLERLYKLFEIFYHKDWNYNHNLPKELTKIQMNKMRSAIDKITTNING